ncbi:MAG: hypothetical protein M1823_001106 [Watsoniomyces obsoletus]|nr:MAG: hypothetical protein M1823_001106 [Watsoniomyces obsoletus]
MSNVTVPPALPPLPSYTLHSRPPLLPLVPDNVLLLLLPIAAYWVFSLFFHYIDINDYWSQYRLHTPAEVLKRNHVSRSEVVRDVVIQQVIQVIVGYLISLTDPEDTVGKEGYDIARWAQRLRLAQRVVPRLLSFAGVNSIMLAQKMGSYPQLAGLLSGGVYPTFHQTVSAVTSEKMLVPTFTGWELAAAKALYWVIVPALQFTLAIVVVDTWQYFLHRAMHMNQWLYRTFHSRHHRLYVPYAYGALYNHPFEGFLLDTLGAGIAYMVAGLSPRQGMWFFTCSTIKTVDDHCGYALPWDPLQKITSNNAGYHDIHHQSWGIKTNFSQPFFTFWDRWLGTAWTGGDVSARYERSRKAAQRQVERSEVMNNDVPTSELASKATSGAELVSQSVLEPKIKSGKAAKQARESRMQVLQDSANGGPEVLVKETIEEKEATAAVRRSTRRSLTSPSQSGSLKSLKDKMHNSLHGRGGTIIGLESSH